MRNVAWITIALLAIVGCSSASHEVDDSDRDLLASKSHHEVVEEEVEFLAAEVQVQATLTVPEGQEDIPAVVLVAGSGPTDRNWNNPMLPGENGTAIELANRLSQAGIAVLRYDKRGTGQTERTGSLDWNAYIAEIEAAVQFLRDDARIDGARIYPAGHSEGGAHALRAVSENRVEVGGLILLASAGRSTEDLVIDQVTRQFESAGMDEETVDVEVASLRTAMDTISRRDRVDAEQVSEIPGIISLVESLQMEHTHEFAAELLPWEPTRAIADVDEPVLILNGLKDTQIDPENDGRRLYDAARSHNEQVHLALIDNADHVLKYQPIPLDEMRPQHALTYNEPTRRLDEGVVEAMVSWIYER